MKKPPPVPCLTLLRTRIDQGAPQHRVLGPTRTSLEGVGRQAPAALLAPSGYSIGSSKARPITNTAEAVGRFRTSQGQCTTSLGPKQAPGLRERLTVRR